MSARELDRADVLRRVLEKRLTQPEASRMLGMSLRQLERLFRSFKREGPAGLISRKRGRPSNRKLPEATRQRVIALVRESYQDFGPTLAREKLFERHGLAVSVETLRQWLLAEGIWATRAQRAPRPHQPRNRRSCLGELIQIDGCDHAWFEDRGPPCTLLVYVDDATGRLMELRFVESESCFSYFAATRSYLERHGKPVALYSDKLSVFAVNKRDVAGDGYTQFSRAMFELNIDTLCANTPQAKGRVERANLTLQDRLVKELRLRGISSMEAGNAYLPLFREDFNRRFAKPPLSPHDAHRPLGPRDDLAAVFTWQEERRLTKDLVLHYKRAMYLLEPSPEALAARRKYVRVLETEDGAVSIRNGAVTLAFRVFEKDRRVEQATVVENKHLGAVLALIREEQLARDAEKPPPRRRRTLREQRLCARPDL